MPTTIRLEFCGVLGTVYRIKARPSSTNEEFTGGVLQRPEEQLIGPRSSVCCPQNSTDRISGGAGARRVWIKQVNTADYLPAAA